MESRSPKYHEKQADQKAQKAATAKPGNKIQLLNDAIYHYEKAITYSPTKHSTAGLHLSVLLCHEEIFDLCDKSSDKKKIAKLMIEKTQKANLIKLVKDKHDLFDIHVTLFNAYRFLEETSEAQDEAQIIKDSYPELENLSPQCVEKEKKSKKDYDANYIKKYKSDYDTAFAYLQSFATEETEKDATEENKRERSPYGYGRTPSHVASSPVNLTNNSATEETEKDAVKENKHKRKAYELTPSHVASNSVNQTNNSATEEAAKKNKRKRNPYGRTPSYVASSPVNLTNNSLDIRQSKTPYVINNYGGTINIFDSKDVIINNFFNVETPKKRVKKKPAVNDQKLEVKTELPPYKPRIEIIDNIIYVDGTETSLEKSGLHFNEDVYSLNGIEIVNKKTAKRLPPMPPAIEELNPKELANYRKKRKREDKKEQLALEKSYAELKAKKQRQAEGDDPQLKKIKKRKKTRASINISELRATALYQPSLSRLKELVTNITTKLRMNEVNPAMDAIATSEMEKFRASNIDTIVIKRSEIAKAPPPLLLYNKDKKNKYELNHAINQFNKGYKAYSINDYKTALDCFLEACLQFKKYNHKQNALHAAHYIEYITMLSFEKNRTAQAKRSSNTATKPFSTKVDSVTTLFIEDLEYQNPAEYPTVKLKPCNQPTAAEYEYSQSVQGFFYDPRIAKAKKSKTKSKQATQLPAFREDKLPETLPKPAKGKKAKALVKKQITSNVVDLHISINARILTEVLNDTEVNAYVDQVKQLAFGTNTANIKNEKDKPQASNQKLESIPVKNEAAITKKPAKPQAKPVSNDKVVSISSRSIFTTLVSERRSVRAISSLSNKK